MQRLLSINLRDAKTKTLMGATLLVSLPTMALSALAQTTTPYASPLSSGFLNPCPGIYYEEPFNSTRIVPQGCPANTFTQQLQAQGTIPIEQSAQSVPYQASTPNQGTIPNQGVYSGSAAITQPPLPSQQVNSIALVNPSNGSVSVSLRNDTNIPITYEAIGYTDSRSISSGQEITLQNLPVPVTITFVRPDNGGVQITPIASSTDGTLSLALSEAPATTGIQGALNIQSDGQVVVN